MFVDLIIKIRQLFIITQTFLILTIFVADSFSKPVNVKNNSHQ